MNVCNVFAIVNQKEGIGKTTTAANLGVALAMQGKKVLIVDADPQGHLTLALGWKNKNELHPTLATHLEKIMDDEPLSFRDGLLYSKEGVDVMPANRNLSGIDVKLVTPMGGQHVMKEWLEGIKDDYDYVLIDCMPSLGMLTVNALTAADKIIIPVQAEYLSAESMTELIRTINRTKRHLNPDLKIEGVLLTLVDERTNLARQTVREIRENYGSALHVFKTMIPRAVKAAEAPGFGKSIFEHDKTSKAAIAYAALAKEVLQYGERKRDTLQPRTAR